jgi:hypothetical protein
MTMDAKPGVSWSGPRTAWLAGDVLSVTLRCSLRELNARFLMCLRRMPEEDLSRFGFSLSVARQLLACETQALVIVAACPYALFDAGFRQHDFWESVVRLTPPQAALRDGTAGLADEVPDYDALTDLVLSFAWHLASTNVLATRLVLGMSPATAEIIRVSSLPAIASAVQLRRRLLRPRWPQRTLYWQRLLAITPHTSNEETIAAQLVGIQLMATDGFLGSGPVAAGARKR